MIAIASANIALGRLGQAEHGLRDALEIEPQNAAAWNNLGVLLVERKEFGEAKRVFQRAFALDSAQSPEIRENLRITLAKLEKPAYSEPQAAFMLVPIGPGALRLVPSH